MRIEPPLFLPPLTAPQRSGTALVARGESAPTLPQEPAGVSEVVHTGEVLPAAELSFQAQRVVTSYAALAPRPNGARAIAAYEAVASTDPVRPAIDVYI